MMKKVTKNESQKKPVTKKKLTPRKKENQIPYDTQPHQCAYMSTCWSAALRCMVILEGYYTGHQNESLRGIYLPHIYEIMFILRPIYLAWPHFIATKEKMEIYEWAEAMYQTWLQRPELQKKNKKKVSDVETEV